MEDECDELIEALHGRVRDHVHLALIADAAPVAEMHLDLAFFSQDQARVAEELCEDA